MNKYMTKTPTTTASAPKLGSLVEAADILGVSARSIRRYIAAGHIRGYRMGPRLIRVDLNEIKDLMSLIPTDA